ncbi:nucleotidyltransferase family protein [Cerasicoccus arenae]|uniref:Nucleotidyltransferase n=1 Tax=Cerasicoccus arenae TaxID=424488 RepID=A0A8J3DBI4_9BACT|nr:NTP transferase domain-containing protein [Cerasicoccus arenae]MBK1856729.1 NTP transferase domain-containing protein [Cerasicoccus arenae]GHB99163.1 nucleotidyltransferase [Cerasicoccus arenae]
MKPTLLVLAAGMGSRYGGLKQLDQMGPQGETLLDYSLRDAHQAGFGKVVFVIRKDFADAFKTSVGARHADQIEVAYAFQELTDLPAGFTVPTDRIKPWGTAHAIRAARDVINEPFVAINADDYYGADAYQRIAQYLQSDTSSATTDIAMVGYPIHNTLSPHGSVNRGVCSLNGLYLQTVEEHTQISERKGVIRGNNLAGESVVIDPKTLVSMNFWAFPPSFFEPLEAYFTDFLRERGNELKSECYIPTVVDDMIKAGQTRCAVLPTTGEWFGVTYPEDKPLVQERLLALTV